MTMPKEPCHQFSLAKPCHMLNLYTLAVKPHVLAEQLNLQIRGDYKLAYQARPGMVLPIIIFTNGKPVIIPAHWGCATEAATMSLNTFPMDRVLTQPPFNRWIHTQRCLVPANCFFARRRDDRLRPDDHDTFLIRLLKSRLFLMGGLYSVANSTQRPNAHSFVLLSTESADVLKTLTDQMPIVLSTDDIIQWLTSEHLIDVMHSADRSGDHWFDYFAVSSDIIKPGINDRNLLRPLDMSLREKEERHIKLKAIDVKQDRFDRRGGKW